MWWKVDKKTDCILYGNRNNLFFIGNHILFQEIGIKTVLFFNQGQNSALEL